MAVKSYTPEVMAQTCDHCGAQVNQRCKNPQGMVRAIPCHGSRLAKVGLKWNPRLNRLEAL